MWSYDGNIVGLLEKSLQPVTHKGCHPLSVQGLESPKAGLQTGSYCTTGSLYHCEVMPTQHWQYCGTRPDSQSCEQVVTHYLYMVIESPKAALHAGSYCKRVAQTVVELWQHNIGNIVRITENRPTSSPHSLALEQVVTHYLYMDRISKGCSSNWKLLQTCSSYRCGVMPTQHWYNIVVLLSRQLVM